MLFDLHSRALLQNLYGTMRRFQLLLAALLAFGATLFPQTTPSTFFPETGPAAIYQRAIDVRSRLQVLSIALQPGFEDLSALAYFRFARGAKILSAYVTNGEAGESDVRAEYPLQLAAIRREEAARALRMLGGDVYFLNLPDVAAVFDTTELRQQWPRDSVQYRLMQLISTFRPDIILIAPDRESRGQSIRWEGLRQDLLRAVERLAFASSGRASRPLPPFPLWTVGRVLVQDGSPQGTAFPVQDIHPVWKKSYETMGMEALSCYESLAIQRTMWEPMKQYRALSPRGLAALRRPDQGLPQAVPEALKPIANQIDVLTRPFVQSPDKITVPQRSSSVLTRLADAIDAVDARLARAHEAETTERKILLQWKEGLEALRLALLGVTVRYTNTESILTDHQMTYLAIDTVTGLSANGKTEVFLPSVGRGWFLNEALENRFPLKLKEQYRLVVQEAKPYLLPHWQYGLQEHGLVRPFYLFVIHKAERREENFVHRTVIPFQFAPRFTIEVLTPIVYTVPDERLVVRLTNNSRDGVRDTLHASESRVVSSRHPFRLSQKGASQTDTLVLNWSVPLPEGSYLMPLKIGEDSVAQYVVRSFPVRVDSTKRIGLMAGVQASPTIDALRRLRLPVRTVVASRSLQDQLRELDVLLIDQRAWTLLPDARLRAAELEEFARRGGHVVVLPQDDRVWNAHPPVRGITLQRTLALSPFSSLVVDASSTVARAPNDLTAEDWSVWLYRFGYNNVSLETAAEWEVVVKERRTNQPLVVSKPLGQGRFTYIDLDLQHQWMNIHAGALRLLANILAR
jgi:hypothetical protein